MNTRVKLI